MTEGDALDLTRQAMLMILVGCGPAVGAAMLVGVVIALLQALTQVQEATLTFVPKIVVCLTVAAFTGPYVGAQLATFADEMIARIEHGF